MCPDIELCVKMVPAPEAAMAPARSPCGCIMRVNPTGPSSTGIDTVVPSTVVDSSGGAPEAAPTRGRNRTAWTASRFASRVRSLPAPPST